MGHKIIKKTFFFHFILIVSTVFFNKIGKFDVNQINNSLVIIKNNAPTGCLTECIKRMSCNLVTYTFPNICNLYYILDDNFCPTNYTKKPSNKTTLYIKSKRSYGSVCKKTNECMEEFGLVCHKYKCN